MTLNENKIITMCGSLAVALALATYVLGILSADRYTFYDGEGNAIPYHAVDSLVRSYFVHQSNAGRDTIIKYFK
jgi:hypothetical protein